MDAWLRAVRAPRARILAIGLPAHFMPPRQPHAHAVASLLLEGELAVGRRRGTRILEAGAMRFAGPGEEHALEAGAGGIRCLLIERAGDDLVPRNAVTCASEDLLLAGRHLMDRLLTGDPLGRARSERLAAELAARTARLLRGLATEAPLWLEELRREIAAAIAEARPAGELRTARLARRAGVHRVHLARAIREHFGSSLRWYVRQLRLELACDLLRTSTMGLAELADAAGFYDQAHLSRWTRGALGATPAELRARAAAYVASVQDASAQVR